MILGSRAAGLSIIALTAGFICIAIATRADERAPARPDTPHASASDTPAIEPSRATPPKPFALTAIWENDGIINPGGPDRYYTNGLLLTLAHQPRWADGIADGLGLSYDATAAGYVLAQQIFTPASIDLNPPDPNDRPYAGYLYGGVYYQREHNHSLDHVQIDLGVVGPSSGADSVQSDVHELFNNPDPLGWDSQIPDTFTYQFTYRKKWRFDLGDQADQQTQDIAWQVIPQVGLELGNVYRQAELAATLRFGQHLPDDYGPGRIGDVASATGLTRAFDAMRRGEAPKWSWYVFGRAGVRFVGHNIFIDGRDSGGGPSVDGEPVVGEFAAGFHIRRRFNNHWSFEAGYAQTYLTHEFEGQSQTNYYATLLVALRATW